MVEDAFKRRATNHRGAGHLLPLVAWREILSVVCRRSAFAFQTNLSEPEPLATSVPDPTAGLGVAPDFVEDQHACGQRNEPERDKRRDRRRDGHKRYQDSACDEARVVEGADVTPLERAEREQVERDAASRRSW